MMRLPKIQKNAASAVLVTKTAIGIARKFAKFVSGITAPSSDCFCVKSMVYK